MAKEKQQVQNDSLQMNSGVGWQATDFAEKWRLEMLRWTLPVSSADSSTVSVQTALLTALLTAQNCAATKINFPACLIFLVHRISDTAEGNRSFLCAK